MQNILMNIKRKLNLANVHCRNSLTMIEKINHGHDKRIIELNELIDSSIDVIGDANSKLDDILNQRINT